MQRGHGEAARDPAPPPESDIVPAGLPAGTRRPAGPPADGRVELSAAQRFFALSEDIFVVVDLDGVVRYLNPASERHLRRPAATLVGQPLATCVAPEDRASTWKASRRAIRDGGLHGFENHLVRDDGSRVRIQWNIQVDVHRKLAYGVGRDVSEQHRLSVALRAAAERVTLQNKVLASAEAAMVITDRNGTLQWVSPSFTRLTGYEAAEAVGRRASLLKSGVQPAAFYRELWATITSGGTWRGELINRRKDGSLYVEEQTITPVVGDGGTITNFIAIKQDVSDRRREQQALREVEAGFQHLFVNNPLPMWVLDRRDERFLAVNEAAVEHFGYDEARFLDMTLADLGPDDAGATTLADLHGSASGVHHTGPVRLRRLDASVLQAELTAHDLTFQGREAVLVVARDVTATLAAERKLQQSEERYRMLAENATDVVYRYRVGADPGFEYVSPSATVLTGFTAEDFYADPHLANAMMDPVDLRRVEDAVAHDGPYLHTVRFVRKDGTPIFIEQHVRRVPGEGGRGAALEGIVRDVTQRVLAERQIIDLNAQLEVQVSRLKTVHRLDTALLLDEPIEVVLEAILDAINAEIGTDAAAVFRLEPDGIGLRRTLTRGAEVGVDRHEVGRGAAGAAAAGRRSVYVPDASEARDAASRNVVPIDGMRGYFALPLVSMGRLEGVLELFSREPLALDEDARVFADAVAQLTAIALQHDDLVAGLQRANADLADAYDRTIEGWARALDLKDEETAGHSQRVTDLSLRLAERLGLAHGELVHLRRGALLHDIGKMGVPDSILLKPGRLTAEEFEVIRRHPTYAVEMLRSIPFLRPALAIPHYHHERWDGSGYPHGLAGERIPLAARIFAVVDVYDALTNDRPYRSAWARADALEHIRVRAGTQFDPRVVHAFLQLVGSGA